MGPTRVRNAAGADGEREDPSCKSSYPVGRFKVQTSCGYGVPRIAASYSPGDVGKAPETAFEDRETMGHWASNKVEKNELLPYQQKWNSHSLDGLNGLRSARRSSGESLWLGDIRARVERVLAQRESLTVGIVVGVLLVLLAQYGQALLVKGSNS